MKSKLDIAVARTGTFECAPILIIGFNRPDLVRDLIRHISFAKPSKIFFAVDGPRNDADCELVRRTQESINLINWECEIKTFFRSENRGCRNAPPEAITWFFEHVEYGIVLEDDCHPAPEFLRFASELLVKYQNNEQIGAVTAFNRHNLQTDKKVSYHFSKDLNIWAWASWRRVWMKYDLSLSSYADTIDSIIQKHTQNVRMRRYYRKAYESVANGGGATWDYQFSFLFMANGYLSVVPCKRLVSNKGIGIAASTHTGGYDFWAEEFNTAGDLDFPLVTPKDIIADMAADERTERIIMGLLPRGLIVIGNSVPCFLRPLVTFLGKVIFRTAPTLFEL
jgi:hypothetical protein